jgi:hypothetical protein
VSKTLRRDAKRLIELRWQRAVIEQELSFLDISETSQWYLRQLLDSVKGQLAFLEDEIAPKSGTTARKI